MILQAEWGLEVDHTQKDHSGIRLFAAQALQKIADNPILVNRAATILGGSWVVISGVISPPIWVMIIVTLFMTLLFNYP